MCVLFGVGLRAFGAQDVRMPYPFLTILKHPPIMQRFRDCGFAALPLQSEYLMSVCLPVPFLFKFFPLLCRCIALHCREEFLQTFCTNSNPQTS